MQPAGKELAMTVRTAQVTPDHIQLLFISLDMLSEHASC